MSLPDGTYTYRRVTEYGPGEDVSATVQGGAVSDWVVNGLSRRVFSADGLLSAEQVAALTAELAEEVRERQRLFGFVHPVAFVAHGGVS